jgi:hypothetical protein
MCITNQRKQALHYILLTTETQTLQSGVYSADHTGDGVPSQPMAAVRKDANSMLPSQHLPGAVTVPFVTHVVQSANHESPGSCVMPFTSHLYRGNSPTRRFEHQDNLS